MSMFSSSCFLSMSECGLITSVTYASAILLCTLKVMLGRNSIILSVMPDNCPSMHVSVTKTVKVKLNFSNHILEKILVSSLHAVFH